MKFSSINRHIIAGVVQSGGKVVVFEETGSMIASFNVTTDALKTSADGSKRRVTEYHRVSVRNYVFEDLYDLILEGNIVYIEGPAVTFEYKGKKYKQIEAVTCSLLRCVNEKR